MRYILTMRGGMYCALDTDTDIVVFSHNKHDLVANTVRQLNERDLHEDK